MASDAFIVGESWISEHYFTTEGKQSFHQRVLDRRKQWDALDESPRSRLGAIAGQLSTALAGLDELDGMRQHEAVTLPLLAALGYMDPLYHPTVVGPLTWLSTASVDAPSVAVVEAKSTQSLEDLLTKDAETLLTPYEVEGEKPVTSLARLLSTILVSDDAPEFIVVFAGRWALLVDRERWPEGRYLAADVQLVAERNETKRVANSTGSRRSSLLNPSLPTPKERCGGNRPVTSRSSTPSVSPRICARGCDSRSRRSRTTWCSAATP